MITRSVPARDGDGAFAIVTTDLATEEPEGKCRICRCNYAVSVATFTPFLPFARVGMLLRSQARNVATPAAIATLRLRRRRRGVRHQGTHGLDFLGLLFESMVVRDLRIYSQAADAEVFHYREKGGLEVYALVQTNDGRWAASEVKLGEERVDEGVRNLLRLAERVDVGRMGEPAALGVIVDMGTPGRMGWG